VSALQLAGGAIVGGIWKVATVVLAVLLLVVITGAGMGWWLAAAARDQALVNLKTEQGDNLQLRLSVRLQNSVVEQMAKSTALADDRRKKAERYAALAVKTTNARETAVRSSTATTCDGVLREAWGQR
jgi:hypothetical protein